MRMPFSETERGARRQAVDERLAHLDDHFEREIDPGPPQADRRSCRFVEHRTARPGSDGQIAGLFVTA